MTNPTKKVHISDLKQGDTVMIDGEMRTVSKRQLTNSPFFGPQYDGYCHYETEGYLDVVLFPKYYQGKIIRWVTQL